MSQTLDAARKLSTAVNRDTWQLADAVLADIPELPHSGGVSATRDALLRERLADLVAELEADGVTTPTGDAYTADSLRTHRQTAMSWPKRERHDEAAYRTHQEAGRVEHKRAVLSALCTFARSQVRMLPADTDADAFGRACDRIALRLDGDKPRRYVVAANDLRIALDRKPNVPTRDEYDSVLGMIAGVHEVAAQLRRIGSSFNRGALDLSEPTRRELVEALTSVAEAATAFVSVVEGVSDADLDALLGVEP